MPPPVRHRMFSMGNDLLGWEEQRYLSIGVMRHDTVSKVIKVNGSIPVPCFHSFKLFHCQVQRFVKKQRNIAHKCHHHHHMTLLRAFLVETCAVVLRAF